MRAIDSRVSIHFETEFVSLTQTGDSVVSLLRDVPAGRVVTVRSSFLLGADGARSTVRDAIGATMIGEGAFSRNFSIIFRAPDLASRHVHERAIMYWMVNEEVPSLLGPMDEAGLWFFMVTKLADDVDPATVDAVDLVRRGTGLKDLDIEIVGTDLWVAHRLVADRYSRDRVFLAGDACHLHPPFGGFGMNMGIGDGVDLGWKMAARLAGWGGRDLLASYEAERRAVHERTIAEAVHNFGLTGNQLVQPALEEPGLIGEATRREVADIIEATKMREFKTLGLFSGCDTRTHRSSLPIAVNRPRIILCFTCRRRIRAVWLLIFGFMTGPPFTIISGKASPCWSPTGISNRRMFSSTQR